ncbi:hypothetical protein ACFLY6_01535 [Candidatus Dependentiae bacterium]
MQKQFLTILVILGLVQYQVHLKCTKQVVLCTALTLEAAVVISTLTFMTLYKYNTRFRRKFKSTIGPTAASIIKISTRILFITSLVAMTHTISAYKKTNHKEEPKKDRAKEEELFKSHVGKIPFLRQEKFLFEYQISKVLEKITDGVLSENSTQPTRKLIDSAQSYHSALFKTLLIPVGSKPTDKQREDERTKLQELKQLFHQSDVESQEKLKCFEIALTRNINIRADDDAQIFVQKLITPQAKIFFVYKRQLEKIDEEIDAAKLKDKASEEELATSWEASAIEYLDPARKLIETYCKFVLFSIENRDIAEALKMLKELETQAQQKSLKYLEDFKHKLSESGIDD